MAWMSDEKYTYVQDCKEKKITARSARHARTHCGKRGSVKLPSDFKTKKELKAMNGECKSYRMNEPMSWEEFVEWPNEHKITYITGIRKGFGISDKYLAGMFGIACNMLLMYIKELGLEPKPDCDENYSRNKFYAWRSGAKTELISENTNSESIDLIRPMPYIRFKTLTNEQKIDYIQSIRDRFSAPDCYIARALSVSQSTMVKITKELNIGLGKAHDKSKRTTFDKDAYLRWLNGTEESSGEDIIEKAFRKHVDNIESARESLEGVEPENVDIPESPIEVVEEASEVCEHAPDCPEKMIRDAGPIAFAGNSIPVIPKNGSMTFENNNVDDILTTLKTMLGGVRANLTVSWEVV